MKYAIREESYSKVAEIDKDAIGEIIAPYINQRQALDVIERFNEKYKVIFDVPAETIAHPRGKLMKLVDDWRDLAKVNANIAFRIPSAASCLFRQSVQVFYDATFAATTYQELVGLFTAGCQEIYVTGSLAADKTTLMRARRFCRIRMIPNFVQTDSYYIGNPNGVDPLDCFWVRPQGVDQYDGCVDVMEFNYDDRRTEEGLLAIYNKGVWNGKLGDIIIDETGKLDNLYARYAAVTDVMKASCKLRCQIGDLCDVCKHVYKD